VGSRSTEAACWHGLPGARATDVGMGEPSLWAVGVLGPSFQVGASGGQNSSPTGKGEPSLQVAEALRSTCRHRLPGAMAAAAAGMGEPSLLACAFCYPGAVGTVLIRGGASFPGVSGEGIRSCGRGEHGAPSSCVCQEAELIAEH
jgi:hypothetical protein